MCKSAIKPVSHDPDLHLSQPSTEKKDTWSANDRANTGAESEDFIELDPESTPPFVNQKRLNDLVRDL